MSGILLADYQSLHPHYTANDSNGDSASDEYIKMSLDSKKEESMDMMDNLNSDEKDRCCSSPFYITELLVSRTNTRGNSSTHPIRQMHAPMIPPICRGARHRNPKFRATNQFRHWWKTSRLLVRLSGSYIYCRDSINWTTLMNAASRLDKKRTGVKVAAHAVKAIGRGGPVRFFLQDAHPFTRTLRIYMAVGRAFEASVDCRFYEVLAAEAMAFMGNRSARWWTRHIIDYFSRYGILPFLGKIFKGCCYPSHRNSLSNEDLNDIPNNNADEIVTFVGMAVIIIMGIIRAVAPFASSFIGSRIGRQTTLTTINLWNRRWKTVQHTDELNLEAGTHRPTTEDPNLVNIMKNVAKAIGDGQNPEIVRRNLSALEGLTLTQTGSGSGGFAVYTSKIVQSEVRTEDGETVNEYQDYKLCISPKGPSLLDEVPRYVLLERRTFRTNRVCEDVSIRAQTQADAIVEGYSYSGAFFFSQEWGALKDRYDNTLSCYNEACKWMDTKNFQPSTDTPKYSFSPPTNLIGLKDFIRTGRFSRKKKKDRKRWAQVGNEVQKLTKKITELKKKGNAPKGIVIYMEGVDCAGKSSTVSLVKEALVTAGYEDIPNIHYNRPPTEEEKMHPWMWRFANSCKDRDNSAIIWDRGPGGDFVYGNLDRLSDTEKNDRYKEFNDFEKECASKSILFCKFLFLTDRDSIAATLGKRLAHKKIVKDLHTWLDASSSSHPDRLGLEEIESHIDPTDFIAFNKYNENLHKFYEFAHKTDMIRCAENGNSWIVVNTSKRHPARIKLLKHFRSQISSSKQYFAEQQKIIQWEGDMVDHEEQIPLQSKPSAIDDPSRKREIQLLHFLETAIYILVLIMIPSSYLHQTWGVSYLWQIDYDDGGDYN